MQSIFWFCGLGRSVWSLGPSQENMMGQKCSKMGQVFSIQSRGIFFSLEAILTSFLISFSGPFFEGYFSRSSASISCSISKALSYCCFLRRAVRSRLQSASTACSECPQKQSCMALRAYSISVISPHRKLMKLRLQLPLIYWRYTSSRFCMTNLNPSSNSPRAAASSFPIAHARMIIKQLREFSRAANRASNCPFYLGDSSRSSSLWATLMNFL